MKLTRLLGGCLLGLVALIAANPVPELQLEKREDIAQTILSEIESAATCGAAQVSCL
jgi:hypothetical protein